MADEPINFLARLKQHHMYGVVVAYAVVVGFLIQLASRAFPYFGWAGAVPTVIVVLLLGFPVVVVLAWLLIEPKGSAKPDNWQRRHWKLSALATAVVIVLVVISGFYALQFSRQHALLLQSPVPTNIQALAAIPAKSIAVLPFENLSADKNNAYFVAGMQDLILTKLADIGDLKVISRTSTMQYGSHPGNLTQIGEQLGVATILEGSVQKAGDQVLINVQLIDTQSDNHLWAESYQRTLDNIFGVEGEVAQKVADALKAKLSPADSARLAAIPTQNPEAWDLYLRALAYSNRANDQYALTSSEMPQAIGLLQQALAKDPNFALADALLARAHMYMFFFGGDRSDARLKSAKDAMDRALRQQPDLGETHLALAIYWYWGFRDYARARAELALARKALPHDSDLEVIGAAIARRQGQWQQTLDGLRQAQTYDPRNASPAYEMGQTYAVLRRYAEANRAYAHAAELSLNPALALVTQAWDTVLWKGDRAPMRAALAALPPSSEDHRTSAGYYFELAWLSRDYAVAAKAVQESDSSAWPAINGNTVLPRRLFLVWAVAASGDAAKAAELYRDLHTEGVAAVRERPGDWDRHLALGFAAAGLGLKNEALREGRRAAELLPVSRDAFAGAEVLSYVARIDVRAGANDQAIALLQRLLAIPAGLWVSSALLRLDPVWDPLRGDPRFQALLKKYAQYKPAVSPPLPAASTELPQ